MQLNVNATGMNAVPFQEGVVETADSSHLALTIFLNGASYSQLQLDSFLAERSGKTGFEWLMPTGQQWAIDANRLCERFSELAGIPWFKGRLVSGYRTEFGSLRGSMGNFDSGGHGMAMIRNHPLTALTFALNADVAADSNNVFYSWMSDQENYSNRGFIQDCLEKALKQIGKDESIGITPALDRDTKGESGSPDISSIIFSKIARARAFVADISRMGAPLSKKQKKVMRRAGVRRTRQSPNPNVLVELGFAAGQLGWERCLLVVNTAFGPVEKLPFDLRGRRILTYHVAEKEHRVSARESFIPLLKSRLIEAMQLNDKT